MADGHNRDRLMAAVIVLFIALAVIASLVLWRPSASMLRRSRASAPSPRAGMLGAWLFGIGWLQRGDMPRQAVLALVGGGAMVASSVRTGITGRSLVEVAGPLDLLIVLALFVGFGALFGWLLAAAASSWRGSTARA